MIKWDLMDTADRIDAVAETILYLTKLAALVAITAWVVHSW